MQPRATNPNKQKTESSFVKFVRAVIWGLVAVVLPISISLKDSAESSASYADGSYMLKSLRSSWLFWFILIIGILNLGWGITRWILRWRREKWTAGKVIGKLIGGGIWRFFVFAPIVFISLVFLAGPVCRMIEGQSAASAMQHVSSITKVYEDYQNGTLSTDEYVLYTAKAAYAQSELPDKYRSDAYVMPPDLLGLLDEHADELSEDTIEYIIPLAFYHGIDFDVDASTNISTHTSILSNKAYAEVKKVTKLNKAKLSKDKHFVVFYTDTGDDKISDAEADTLGDMLEEIIANYQTNLGEVYKYERQSRYDAISSIKISKVLEANGLDTNIIDTAMPVYIADPYDGESSILASYAGQKFNRIGERAVLALGSLVGEGSSVLYNSAPSYPFINILPKNIHNSSLAIVTAHELGHHYNSDYCYDHFGKPCKNADFVGETLPNYMAINVMYNQPPENLLTKNHYNYSYLQLGGTRYPINKANPGFEGYPAVAFAENYGELVPNGYDIMRQSLRSDNPIETLSQNAGDLSRVMMQLAQRNLTNDYDSKLSLQATTIPKGEPIPCSDYCNVNYKIDPVSTRYFYFATKEYKNAKIVFSGTSQVGVSMLGRNKQGKWEVVSSKIYGPRDVWTPTEYAIDGKYEVVALAIVNYNYALEEEFSLKIANNVLDKIIDKADDNNTLKFDGSEEVLTDLGNGCYEAHLSSLFDLISDVTNLGSEALKTITELDPDNDYTDFKNQVDEENNRVQQDITEAKKNTENYRTVICYEILQEGYNFDQAKAELRQTLEFSLDLFDHRDEDMRTGVLLGLDLVKRSSKVYVLRQDGDYIGLILINITEK